MEEWFGKTATYSARLTRRALLRRVGTGGIAIAASPLLNNIVALGAGNNDERDTFSGRFEMKIYEGPSKGTEIKGALSVQASRAPERRGELVETVLVTDDFKIITVTGQITGQAVNLAFRMPDGSAVMGTGAMQNPATTITPRAGGESVGPRPADYGVWMWELKNRDART